MAKKDKYTVVRNGEQIAVCDTKERADWRIETEKQIDARCYEIGFTKARPDTISYFIIVQ